LAGRKSLLCYSFFLARKRCTLWNRFHNPVGAGQLAPAVSK
jgi:hypothetical protein